MGKGNKGSVEGFTGKPEPNISNKPFPLVYLQIKSWRETEHN
jgi:hypothetical protein